MPGEWPLARLKEPVQSMLAPLQSCVCINSMDGCAVCVVTSSRMAHRVRSSWQSTYGVEYATSAARQSAELAEDCVGWMGVGSWGTIAAERGELRRAFGLVVKLLVCAPLLRIPASKVLPKTLSSDHLVRRKVLLSNGQEPSTMVEHSFFLLSPGVVRWGEGGGRELLAISTRFC